MASPGLVFLEGLLAVAYILLAVQRKNGIWLLWAVVFAVTAVIIRYSIQVDSVRDFRPYFDSFLQVKYGAISVTSVFEPYRLILFKAVLLFGKFDDLAQIGVVYYFHFLVVTGFFLWLAAYREVTFESKLILFLAFYPTMAFVWIRSGMVYVAACYMFLSITNRKWRPLQFLLPLIHVSVIPLLLVIKIKDLNPARKALIILVALAAGYFVLESSYAQYIITKLDRYSETSGNRDSIELLLFHVANILAFIYLAVINSKFRKNFAVLLLMATYLAMYAVNPVVGLRMFPLVLIASIVQRIAFPRYQVLTLLVSAAYIPVYLARFGQVVLW